MGVDELLAQPIANGRSLVGRRIGRHFPGHGRYEGCVAAWEEGEGEAARAQGAGGRTARGRAGGTAGRNSGGRARAGSGARAGGGASGGYRLQYDDGDEESHIPLAEVLRLLLPPSSGKSAKKRARSAVSSGDHGD